MHRKATFEHPPLDLSEKNIRLIRIFRGNDDSIIKFSMSVERLRGNHVALSYVRGTDEPSHQIAIDGRPFFVRQNLFDFLLYARKALPFQILWIDAICINQEHIKEKNHQVRHMVEIYERATYVISWIGKGSDDIKRLFRSLPRCFEQSVTTHLRRLDFDYWNRLENDVLALCKAEYWSRLWIVPEIYKAGTLIVVYDDIDVAWTALTGFVKQICQFSKFSMVTSRSIRESKLGIFAMAENEDVQVQGTKLLGLVNRFGSSKCTDPRDRIFALTPLSSDATGYKADYKINRVDLFGSTSKTYKPKQNTAVNLLRALFLNTRGELPSL